MSATPKVLRYDGGSNPNVQVIRDEWDTILQVMAPEVLADVHIIDAYSYEIRFYDPLEVEEEVDVISVGSGPGAIEEEIPTGRYDVSGAVPFSIWKIENPDGASAHDRLEITQTLGEGNSSYAYIHDGAEWSFESGGGLKKEERVETTLVNDDAGAWIETLEG